MEVLNTYQQLTDNAESVILLMIIIGLFVILAGIICIIEKYINTGIAILVFVVTVLFLLIFNYSNLPRNTFHEVIMSDLGEFEYEKYEIISQKGKILTIKEVK